MHHNRQGSMPTGTKKAEPVLWTESKLGPTTKERKVAEVTGRRGESSRHRELSENSICQLSRGITSSAIFKILEEFFV